MKFPNPFHHEDKGLEFKQNLVHQEQNVEANRPGSSMEDLMEMTQKIGYLTIDETVHDLLHDNVELNHWLLVLTPLNNTTKLNKHQADLQDIRIENYAAMQKLIMKPSTYEINGFEVVEGLRNFGHMRVCDAVEGWKGHLCTENVKRIEAGVLKK